MLYATLSEGFELFSSDIGHSRLLESLVRDQFPFNLERDLDRGKPFSEQGFSIVSFCEVMEHLRVNPVKVLRFMRSNLSRNGFLYLTTPNFYRRSNVLAFWQRQAMQPIVPAALPHDQIHSHHVREYCAKELIDYAKESGLKLTCFYFSSCWDEPTALQDELEDQLANLVFVFQRDDADVGITATSAE
jgi:2-polyprenyl-3-methyl-5-hydroxy-6-metoxy-1,4-benzoquinol methylase